MTEEDACSQFLIDRADVGKNVSKPVWCIYSVLYMYNIYTIFILINAHIWINTPLPSLERNINWPKTSNNRPSSGLTWTILHHISGNTNFSVAKFGQCLFNQETDFLFVRKFSSYDILRWDVHTPTSSPHAFGCTAGHTSWDSEDLNSVECAQNVKQGLTQALKNISDNNFCFLYHKCCTAVSVFLVHDGLWL